MNTNTYLSNVVYMKSLKNLFIELTAKNCNEHCKHCYIDFPKYKKANDFMPIDKIKEAINDTTNEDIEWIYLMGAEPMTHPDFNAILRFCLKRANVCICTNGSFINEKKARFLKKVEDESDFQIVFKLSLNHYDEMKNDDVRYRGAFRHTIFAIKYLLKYDFMQIISFANFYNLDKEDILQGLSKVFSRNNFDLSFDNLQIIPWYRPEDSADSLDVPQNSCLDCQYGRVLTLTGVYTCPFLANDYRGRCGGSFVDYNKKNSLETSFCNSCIKSNNFIFSLLLSV